MTQFSQNILYLKLYISYFSEVVFFGIYFIRPYFLHTVVISFVMQFKLGFLKRNPTLQCLQSVLENDS